MSIKFTPTAATSTTTWPGPGRGASCSVTLSTSGPPRRSPTTTRILTLSLSPAALDQPFTRPSRPGQPQPDLNAFMFVSNGGAGRAGEIIAGTVRPCPGCEVHDPAAAS